MPDFFFTADPHFGHGNIIRHADRPFSDTIEMDQALIDGWNARVRKGDVVYLLGDVSFHRDPEQTERILRALKGEIHLVRGNHDERMKSWLFDRFVSVSDLRDIKVGGQRIVLCHYAMRVWNRAHHGSWMLHGHSHGTLPDIPTSLSFDVGVDPQKYQPISFDEVGARMAMKTWRPVDHHGSAD